MEKHAKYPNTRREELLGHAIAMIRQTGLASLTMKKLAARVGFTETAAYRYFPNKQELLLALVDKIGTSLLGPVREIAASPGSPSERVEAIIRFHIDFVLRLDGLPITLLSEAAAIDDERILGKLRETIDEYLRLLGGVIGEMGSGADGIRSSDAALLLMGIPAILAIRRRIGADPEIERRASDELLPFIVRCLAREAEQPGGHR